MHPLIIVAIVQAQNAERIKEAEGRLRARLDLSRLDVSGPSEQRRMFTRLHRWPVPAPSALCQPMYAPVAATPMARIARSTSRWWVNRDHPVRMALTLAMAATAASVAVAIIGQAVFPNTDPILIRLVAVLLMAAASTLIVARAGAWSKIGAAGSATWAGPGLLLVPALVALAPLATGLNLPAAGTLLVLVVGYAATGLFEELWHRGVILDTLRTCGIRKSAVIGGALFATSHWPILRSASPSR